MLTGMKHSKQTLANRSIRLTRTGQHHWLLRRDDSPRLVAKLYVSRPTGFLESELLWVEHHTRFSDLPHEEVEAVIIDAIRSGSIT